MVRNNGGLSLSEPSLTSNRMGMVYLRERDETMPGTACSMAFSHRCQLGFLQRMENRSSIHSASLARRSIPDTWVTEKDALEANRPDDQGESKSSASI